MSSFKDPNLRSPRGTLPDNYQSPNLDLSQAEYSAGMGRYNKAAKKPGLLARFLLFFGVVPKNRS